jgi:hydrogenase maturation protease
MRVVVAGFGNVLRRDDGFGVAVIDELGRASVPPEVELVDIGIGGVHLVQLLSTPADALVVLDAVDIDRPAGTVAVIDPDVEDVGAMGVMQRRDHLADMHYSTPDRAMMLAGAMGVLPERRVVVGCQPADADTYEQGLTPPVAAAVAVAADEVRRIVSGLGVAWSFGSTASG